MIVNFHYFFRNSLICYSFSNMQRTPFLILISLALFGAGLPVAAQKFQPKTIQFKGDPEYSDQELLAAADLKKGSVFTTAEMNDHSKRLMDSGVFDSLSFKFDGVDLIYTLIPSSTLYPVRLENLPIAAGPELDAKLHERLPLYHGKVPSEGTLLDGVRTSLEEMLAAQGIKATVSAVPSNGPGGPKAGSMSFSIDAPAILVGEIRPDPSSPPLDTGAQEIIAKLSGSPYNVVGSPSQIATYLSNYYHDKGYLEADIHAVPQGAPAITPEAVHVPFAVSVAPGPIYRLASVKFDPGVLVTQAEFDHQSSIHPGDIADGQHVTQNWQYIARQYHNKGYIKASVHPTAAFDRAQGTVTFTVSVDPGPQYTMGTLKVENVSDELRAAIQAAWGMPAGAVFNEGAIRGFFATQGVHPALERVFSTVNLSYVIHPNEDSHTIDLTLRLEKKH
jgi:outer membrane protein assembly factor BamA